MQQAELRLVLRDYGRRECVDEVQFPVSSQAISVFEEIRKVIAGLEKDHRNTWNVPANHVKHNHVLGLKVVCQTKITSAGLAKDVRDHLLSVRNDV